MSFKKGDWYCAACNNHNFAFRTSCKRCAAPKADSKSLPDVKQQDWRCNGCHTTNWARRTTCRKCGLEKGKNKPVKAPTKPIEPVIVESEYIRSVRAKLQPICGRWDEHDSNRRAQNHLYFKFSIVVSDKRPSYNVYYEKRWRIVEPSEGSTIVSTFSEKCKSRANQFKKFGAPDASLYDTLLNEPLIADNVVCIHFGFRETDGSYDVDDYYHILQLAQDNIYIVCHYHNASYSGNALY